MSVSKVSAAADRNFQIFFKLQLYNFPLCAYITSTFLGGKTKQNLSQLLIFHTSLMHKTGGDLVKGNFSFTIVNDCSILTFNVM